MYFYCYFSHGSSTSNRPNQLNHPN